jgi:hypothetical protein
MLDIYYRAFFMKNSEKLIQEILPKQYEQQLNLFKPFSA